MSRKIGIVLLFIAFTQIGFAQQGKTIRVGLDTGPAVSVDGGGGFSLALEPKFNITRNLSIGGMLFGSWLSNDLDADERAVGGVLGTIDYYFTDVGIPLVPFVGAGAGSYGFTAITATGDPEDEGSDLNLGSDTLFGGMVRAGLEWRKLRFSTTYHILPATKVSGIFNNGTSSVENAHLTFTIGVFFGGGKW